MINTWRSRSAVAGAAAVATAVVVLAWPSHSPHRPVPAAAPVPVTTVAPTTTAPPAPPHDFVAPAAPSSFVMSGRAFTIKAHVCQMDFVLPLDPPGDQFHTVCWVKRKFGVAPGSDTAGTSYILGHAWAEQRLVLNPLSERAMLQVTGHRPSTESGVPIFPVTNVTGYSVVLTTPKGRLTYQVTRAFAVTKENAIKVPSIMTTSIPNRVVIITCGVKNGRDLDYNIIVYADLFSSVAA
jgi:Sortase domain